MLLLRAASRLRAAAPVARREPAGAVPGVMLEWAGMG